MQRRVGERHIRRQEEAVQRLEQDSDVTAAAEVAEGAYEHVQRRRRQGVASQEHSQRCDHLSLCRSGTAAMDSCQQPAERRGKSGWFLLYAGTGAAKWMTAVHAGAWVLGIVSSYVGCTVRLCQCVWESSEGWWHGMRMSVHVC